MHPHSPQALHKPCFWNVHVSFGGGLLSGFPAKLAWEKKMVPLSSRIAAFIVVFIFGPPQIEPGGSQKSPNGLSPLTAIR
jgi:hypothetical protein